LNLYI